MIRKIGILTSGGDAPGMNAVIRAVTRTALSNGIEVMGIQDGYKGLVEGRLRPLGRSDVSNLLSRGGTILGSARLPEFKNEEVLQKACEVLAQNEVDALCAVGGDGTFRGCLALTQKGINCIGIPGTIDNDIAGTELTIGFDTALNTIVDCVDKLRDTSASHHRCSLVEVMGNRCGDLAIYSGLSTGAEILITPETGFDEDGVVEKLAYLERQGKNHAIVIVSEKVTDINKLAAKIDSKTGFSSRVTVLGHIQRGGAPTPNDRVLACRLGEKAVDLILEGIGGHCVGIVDNKIVHMPIEEALNQTRESKKELYRLFDRLV